MNRSGPPEFFTICLAFNFMVIKLTGYIIIFTYFYLMILIQIYKLTDTLSVTYNFFWCYHVGEYQLGTFGKLGKLPEKKHDSQWISSQKFLVVTPLSCISYSHKLTFKNNNISNSVAGLNDRISFKRSLIIIRSQVSTTPQ